MQTMHLTMSIAHPYTQLGDGDLVWTNCSIDDVNDDGVAGAAGVGVADDGYDLDPDSFPPGPVCLPDPAHN